MQLDEFAGHYDGMRLSGNPGINVPEGAFDGVTFDKVGKNNQISVVAKKWLWFLYNLQNHCILACNDNGRGVH